MSNMRFTALMLLVAAMGFGCGSAGGQLGGIQATVSKAPEVGKADSQDSADRLCQVVMRDVGRTPAADSGDYETDCSLGTCYYVWRGRIDVAESIPFEATVHVLYHLTSDPLWYEAAAESLGTANYGYRSYAFAISDRLFGPGGGEGQEIELVAFLRYPDGSRLFDHNNFPGDFENARLTAESNFGGSWYGCQPVRGLISFWPGFSHDVYGNLRQGGYLEIQYSLERLPDCRDTHNGYPCWDILAHVRFLPGGQETSASVRRFVYVNGSMTNQPEPQPFVTLIPEDAVRVEVWFENYSGCGSSCRAWDSNYGANYVFEIWPPADHPRCQNVEKDNPNIHYEDFRMPHNEPYCLPYELAAQYDANFCEFWPEDLGLGYVGHYGIPFRWLFANLKLGAVEGTVLNAGLFTRYHHNADGKEAFMYSLGAEQLPGQWRVGFAYVTYSQDVSLRRDYTIDEFAFFIDVRRPAGEVVRLWQSRGGANYRMSDILSYPTYTEYIPYGNIQWADQAAAVFDSKRACTD